VAEFFTGHRGYVYASTALMDPMSKAFVADIHHFIAVHGLELVHFGKGQRKDEVTQRLLAGFTAAEGVLYVGRAQEKSNVADPAPPPRRRQFLRVAGAGERVHQLLLLLLRGRRLRPVLPHVLYLLPVHRQAVHQRQRVGQAAGRQGGDQLRGGDVVIDLAGQQVTSHGQPVHLTPTEFALLRELAVNRGKLLTHAYLLRRVWGQGYVTQTEYVRVYVRRLRAKLEGADGPPLILTHPRAGYRMAPE
jgi:hypothetical protein